MPDENVVQPADAPIPGPDTQTVVETETLPTSPPPATQTDPMSLSPNSSVPTDLPTPQPVTPSADSSNSTVQQSSTANVVTQDQPPIIPTPQPSSIPAPTPVIPLPPITPGSPIQVPNPSEPQVQSKFPTWNWREMLIRARESVQLHKKAKLEKIMKLAREKHSITNDQVQLLLRVSDATARSYIKQLIQASRLRAVGSDNNRKFEAV